MTIFCKKCGRPAVYKDGSYFCLNCEKPLDSTPLEGRVYDGTPQEPPPSSMSSASSCKNEPYSVSNDGNNTNYAYT